MKQRRMTAANRIVKECGRPRARRLWRGAAKPSSPSISVASLCDSRASQSRCRQWCLRGQRGHSAGVREAWRASASGVISSTCFKRPTASGWAASGNVPDANLGFVSSSRPAGSTVGARGYSRGWSSSRIVISAADSRGLFVGAVTFRQFAVETAGRARCSCRHYRRFAALRLAWIDAGFCASLPIARVHPQVYRSDGDCIS